MIRSPSRLLCPLTLLSAALAMTACKRDVPPTEAVPAPAPAVVDTAAPATPLETVAPVTEPAPALPPQETMADASTQAADPAPASVGADWQYTSPDTPDGAVPTARIASSDGAVTLVLESHPVSGRKGYLQLPALPKCPSMSACRITIARDGGSGEEMMVSELTPPDSRLYLFDPRGLWRSLDGVQTLRITYPAASGPATAEFDVSGTDLTRLPRWSR